MTESSSESLWKRDQNSRSHTVARKRCEFTAIRDVSTQIHFESASNHCENATKTHSEYSQRDSVMGI